MRKSLKDQSGVSLIELLVVIVLLGTGFFVLLQVLTFSSDTRAEAEIRTTQATLAGDLLNEIRSQRYDEFLTEEWSLTLGPEEATPVEYDDVDDYNGWLEPAVLGYPHYSRSVEVAYVDVQGDLKLPAAVPTDYKLVTVTVGHKTLSDIVDSLVISPGIPFHSYNDPFCLAEGIELKNVQTQQTHIFYGPFPKRQMTLTIDGGTGTFIVDCTSCLEVGYISGALEITDIKDPTGQIAAACGGP